MSFLVRLPHPSTTQASMVRLEPPTSPAGLTEEMTILRRLPPPRPAPLLLLLQNLLGPRPDPASPRLLRRRLGTTPPSHVDPNGADGSHDPGQRPGTHRKRTLSSGTHQLTAKLHAHRLAVPGYPQGQLASGAQGALVDLQLSGHHQEHPLGVLLGAYRQHFALLQADEARVSK